MSGRERTRRRVRSRAHPVKRKQPQEKKSSNKEESSDSIPDLAPCPVEIPSEEVSQTESSSCSEHVIINNADWNAAPMSNEEVHRHSPRKVSNSKRANTRGRTRSRARRVRSRIHSQTREKVAPEDQTEEPNSQSTPETHQKPEQNHEQDQNTEPDRIIQPEPQPKIEMNIQNPNPTFNTYIPSDEPISPSLLQSSPPEIINVETPSDSPWMEFSINRTVKGSKFRPARIELHDVNSILMTAVGEHNEYGQCYRIFNSLGEPLGMVIQNDDNQRFTLITQLKKPRDDRDGEVLGAFLSKQSRTIAIPVTGKEHFAISERLSLATVAKTELSHPLFKLMKNGEKSYDPQFGSQLVCEESIKNTILLNNQVPVFVLYKQNQKLLQLKFRTPLTLYQAFGLAVSIINYAS